MQKGSKGFRDGEARESQGGQENVVSSRLREGEEGSGPWPPEPIMASVACLPDREGSELAKEASEKGWGWEPDWSGWRSEWRCGNGCGDSLFQKTGLHGRNQAAARGGRMWGGGSLYFLR